MRLQPSARDVRELRAVALALRFYLDRDIKRDISKSIRDTLNPIWRDAIESFIGTKMDRLIFGQGARIAPGNPAKAMAGTSRRALADGLTPAQGARAWEFGAPTRIPHQETYQREGHQVTRHTKRQVPRAVKTGRVVYPAFAKFGPRMVSLWVQIIVRNIHEKLEGK